MLKDITLGQYFPGNTIVHRLDPRTKILITVALMVVLFSCDSFPAYVVLTAFIAGMIRIANLRVKMVLRGLKPLMVIILFTGVLNLFLTPGEDILWRFGFVSITTAGVHKAVLIIVRLVLLIAGTSLLTYTTSPIQLTDGLERLFSPLKKIHAPVHELTMMMSLALRFIPTLIEETDKIMSAQRARGADFDSGNLLHRAKALVPILVPLFVSSFRRADELATAMECRLYRGDNRRTRLRQLQFSREDGKCAAITALILGGVVLLEILF